MKKKLMRNSLLLLISLPSFSFAVCSDVSQPMSVEAITQRIKRIGTVEVEGAQKLAPIVKAVLGPKAGEERYKSTCAVCHDTGVASAPKFRNQVDWKPRMKEGMDAMLAWAIKGRGGMPPKGTCMQCSDEELKMAIEHMLPK